MNPILFNTEMVRAILDGRKTVTRRVVKPQPKGHAALLRTDFGENTVYTFEDGTVTSPHHRPGEILYVRETFFQYAGEYVYRASAAQPELWGGMWRPSIHMPREVARIFLRVTDVRVERLQEITDKQALEEGVPEDSDYPLENPVYCPKCKGEGLLGAVHPVSLGYMDVDCPYCDTPKKRFANLWDSTIKKSDRALYGWEANPWVWVIAFEKISKEEAMLA